MITFVALQKIQDKNFFNHLHPNNFPAKLLLNLNFKILRRI